MKQFLRNRISRSASYFEICLSFLILMAVLLVAIEAVVSLVISFGDLFHGTFTFNLKNFMGLIIELIIAVEFVKMISKHTPDSTIEVLLFVIARKIVIDEPAYLEIVLGVLAIGTLFVIKRYFTQKTNPKGCILEAGTNLRELNGIIGGHFTTDDGGNTLRDILMNLLIQSGQKPYVGLEIPCKEFVFKIYSMRDSAIDAVEVVPLTVNNFLQRLLRKFH
jgi:hypothetical protein